MAGGTTAVYKVVYHFEQGSKKISPEYSDYVSAADTKYDTIATILSNNSLNRGSGKLVLDSVQNIGMTAYIA